MAGYVLRKDSRGTPVRRAHTHEERAAQENATLGEIHADKPPLTLGRLDGEQKAILTAEGLQLASNVAEADDRRRLRD
jgi:hypothetical protein